MNEIRKSPIRSIGYGFIPAEHLPGGCDEYHLRFRQNPRRQPWRHLSTFEVEALVRNHNTSDDWTRILVTDPFHPELVRHCKFFGLVRIGRLEPWYLEFHNLRLPVGLYDSTIISSDLGDNVAVSRVAYLSHYIIGDDAILANIDELATSSTAKFGNGIVKDGEPEQVRIRLEVCNENGGRSILPFDGMLPGDAWIWSRHRDDRLLQQRLLEFTEALFDSRRGYYGVIGDRTVIKNCSILKDVRIGTDAYLKGANKIKNVTINSSADAMSQVGEGCELVNGIIGQGCRVFYGVKAVRFVMASNSQLKYGARLINAYLGDNATISCCEVLNALIFPFHEQHHNNSFLCASVLMGQSNMAAGATLGSNHNSRANDGELVAGRGFWPGLCVSVKHNSVFASFNILAKGDYAHEIRCPFPFALLSLDIAADRLQVMPAYWFAYNLYGLCRNEWKYAGRDGRPDRVQRLETAFLAPDTANEMLEALDILRECVGRAALLAMAPGSAHPAPACRQEGRRLLEADDPAVDRLTVAAPGIERSRRPTILLKVRLAYRLYQRMLRHYAMGTLIDHLATTAPEQLAEAGSQLPEPHRTGWVNLGGQLMPEPVYDAFRDDLREGRLRGWDQVHAFYRTQSAAYDGQRLAHALGCLSDMGCLPPEGITPGTVADFAAEVMETGRWIHEGVLDSRRKDFSNPFRRMVYANDTEMTAVLGPADDNAFLRDHAAARQAREERITRLLAVVMAR
jgi:NDP-sugar pyrophosphorylase family protein